MVPMTLTDLPPELLDHITTYLHTAQNVANLGRVNRSLCTFVEKDAWQTFARTQFPSLCPANTPSHRDTARTLTSTSKAWDQRAFVARYVEPRRSIRVLPGDRTADRWKRPRGQTIGFTPQLDCFEQTGATWKERKEVLAFSAGAEICLRQREFGGRDVGEKWTTYRPFSAEEGKDDVTTLHLIRPQGGDDYNQEQPKPILGTANGDLQLLHFPSEPGADISKTYFTTQGLPVRSSSIFQRSWKLPMLAVSLGDTRISVFTVDPAQPKIAPSTAIDVCPPNNQHRGYRAWSTSFLSSTSIAIGLGPSEEPIHVYSIESSGLNKTPVRKFSLQNDLERLEGIAHPSPVKRPMSAVYPIKPLPPSSIAAGSSCDVFLSGAYDGIIRLHDLRSHKEYEQEYTDPTDDSAIYSLLPHGQELLVAGTSRHSLLKVFDLRLGARLYSFRDSNPSAHPVCPDPHAERKNWSLFLKPHSATYPGRGGGNNWVRRSAESSIYSLASPSPQSPYLYAGVENAVLELAFTRMLDPHPDPIFFRPGRRADGRGSNFLPKEVLDLAMYDQTQDMKLSTQRSMVETWRLFPQSNSQALGADSTSTENWTLKSDLEGLDERWKRGSS